jgi:hypothetical protein
LQEGIGDRRSAPMIDMRFASDWHTSRGCPLVPFVKALLGYRIMTKVGDQVGTNIEVFAGRLLKVSEQVIIIAV